MSRHVLAVVFGAVLLATGACTSAPPETETTSSAQSEGDTATPGSPVPSEGATAPEPPPAGAGAATSPSPDARPVVVVTTERGTFEIEMYPAEAPRTVAHILALVKRNFYNGQRVHRVVPGFVIQFGDPNTRDARLRHLWGTGGSGKAVGVGEWNPKRPHRRGAVAMAHAGDPAGADSQMYVILADSPSSKNLDGGYTVFGQVISGMDVVLKTQENDAIKRVALRDASAPATAPATN